MPQKILAKTVLAFSLLGGLVTSFDFLQNSAVGYRERSLVGDESIPLFRGNTTHRDYFKLLREDSGSVLVGARNIIYNLSLPDLSEHIQEVNKLYLQERLKTNLRVKQEDFPAIGVIMYEGSSTFLAFSRGGINPLKRF